MTIRILFAEKAIKNAFDSLESLKSLTEAGLSAAPPPRGGETPAGFQGGIFDVEKTPRGFTPRGYPRKLFLRGFLGGIFDLNKFLRGFLGGIFMFFKDPTWVSGIGPTECPETNPWILLQKQSIFVVLAGLVPLKSRF